MFKMKVDNTFTKRLQRDCERLVRDGAREFVRATILQVPQWSGHAAGSIKFAQGINGQLAAFLRVAVPITPSHPNPKKTPESGGQFGSYSFGSSRNIFSFKIQTDLIYYVIQDFINIGISPNAPWRSFEAGLDAFQTRITERLQEQRFTKLNSALVFTEVTQLE